MDYIGEHLLPGQIGHLFIVLSLVASLVATFSFFKSAQAKTDMDASYWRKLARYAFIIETVSVIAVFVSLFYIISNHLFEYKYAWQHSSLSLEPKYLLACFWEGQEGSFLLWSFWHCVLGLIIIGTGKKWEAPVMTIVSFAQFCLATMVVGIYIFHQKIGSNPFILLRDSGVLDNAPFYHLSGDVSLPLRPDYLSDIRDGNDLNPLLQNYWMVIHPPVLFLGFASTIIPFAFAVSGLWKKKFGEWINMALPWSLFSAAVLGVGIMMGGAWAYESLNFGGYWAWDPVENASLVPWLIMIAGIHTLLIYKHSGYSLRSTHLFFILSFVLILYSTFLTRSGILGDASVHAFTDLGMNVQLYLFLFVFIWGSGIISAKNIKQKIITAVCATVLLGLIKSAGVADITLGSGPLAGMLALLTLIAGIIIIIYQIQTQVPAIKKEESGSSREFWMFIGSLVFFLSAIVIISQTSAPVINKTFGTKIATPEDKEFAYNSIQIYIAIIIGVLTAVTQYLRYKNTSLSYLRKKLLVPTIISIAVSIPILAFGDIDYQKQGPVFLGAIWLAVVCSVYAAIANAAYIWIGMKGKLNLSGGSVAHMGFGLVLLGILISSSKKEILSYNTSGISVPFGEDSKENPGENLTLVKGVPTRMGKYDVTYINDSAHPKKPLWFYNLSFKSREDNEQFTLKPNAFINYKGNEGLMANPDARHYWNHDIFTYITALTNPEKNNDTSTFRPHTLKSGDSVFYSNGFMVLQDVKIRDSVPEHIAKIFGENGGLYEATFKLFSQTGSIYTTTPVLAVVNGSGISIPDTIPSENLVLKLEKINEDNTIEMGIKESDTVMQWLTLKAYKFPFINLLWLGILITATGIIISMVRRIQLNRRGEKS